MIKVALFLAGTISSAGAQILLKTSATEQGIMQQLFSLPVVIALGLYVISFICYAAFLRDAELSLASPLFVGGVLLVIFVYGLIGGEAINLLRALGATLIVAGLFLLQFSAG